MQRELRDWVLKERIGIVMCRCILCNHGRLVANFSLWQFPSLEDAYVIVSTPRADVRRIGAIVFHDMAPYEKEYRQIETASCGHLTQSDQCDKREGVRSMLAYWFGFRLRQATYV